MSRKNIECVVGLVNLINTDRLSSTAIASVGLSYVLNRC